MAKKARNNEIEAAAPRKPATRKRKSDEIDQVASPRKPATTRKRKRRRKRASTAASGMCDDVIRSIFARLPARTLVASMALSTHHRRMILSPEFISLHRRLGPPLPHPHIAFIAKAKIRNSSGEHVVSGFHRFHVAGEGIGCDGPMRSLAGSRYIKKKYVNTCNGIVLLAGSRSRSCVLWNPCVANSEKEVTIPDSTSVLGFGYGTKSQTYKLLLSRRCKGNSIYDDTHLKGLLVYSLHDAGEQRHPPLRAVLPGQKDGEGFFYKPRYYSDKVLVNSLYIDGIIYLLHVSHKVVFAFDVDGETITTINLPDKQGITQNYTKISRLMEISGRPCIETNDWRRRTVWMLTMDHRWEPRCVIKQRDSSYSTGGIWDCGGMLVMYLCHEFNNSNKLYLYNPSIMKVFGADLPPNLMLESRKYAFCWGYKPTLVSPGSIVGELGQEEERCRDRATDITELLKPINEQEKRKGQEETLTTVCFMEFLVGILRKLPDNMQEAIQILHRCR